MDGGAPASPTPKWLLQTWLPPEQSGPLLGQWPFKAPFACCHLTIGGGGHTPPLRRTGEAKRNLEDQGWRPPPLLSVDLPFLCRLIELHSPDSRNTLILRCKDTATAHSWFMAIHTNIMALLPQVLAELNAMLGASHTAGSSREVKQIAWLAEQVSPSPGTSVRLAFFWRAAGGRGGK